ncbi:MAG TPA: DegT/DnrJ/EryC1/StrS family aminotransferase, partial [Candidatus Cloacimonadota bacterium]|nr:DegT/DnrJ/EryC1/StrS family aminotransferase [Candidatus Cloacimonadota bacterium]
DRRDELMKELQSKEIGCAIYYPLPLHLQECFAYLGYKKGDCPISERIANQVLSIPIYSELPAEQIRFVADTIIKFYNK